MKITDISKRIPCEQCYYVRRYPDFCDSGRRCGILCGPALTLPWTKPEDYVRLRTSERDSQSFRE